MTHAPVAVSEAKSRCLLVPQRILTPVEGWGIWLIRTNRQAIEEKGQLSQLRRDRIP
jgi:hypothetical protein